MTSTISQPAPESNLSTVDELVALGCELNANQYRAVHLAARYDEELEWFHQGFKSPSANIANRLQIHASTAREWIRVGYSLRELDEIDAAFRSNDISYAKARILTRWANPDNEQQLLVLARSHTANRLTTAIANVFAADGETDNERDQRHHNDRSFSSFTDGDGMVIIRIALPPSTAKPIVAAVEELVTRIAQTPADTPPVEDLDASADAHHRQSVNFDPSLFTRCGSGTSADAPSGLPALSGALADLRRRWQPDGDHSSFPTMAQQRADAFAALFLNLNIDLTSEVVIHIRGDGNTFDDGTPITTNAIARQLDDSFIRLLIHDAQRRPIDASSRRRHPTMRQKRVAMETHNHECVDCRTTELLELDHNPAFHQTRRTVANELEPRCAPCHRARHRTERRSDHHPAAH